MALHTKKEFALLCGIINASGQGDTKKLSTYHSRKKLVYSGDYVDDSIRINKDFLSEWKLKTESKPITPARATKELKLIRPLTASEMISEENPDLSRTEKPNTGDSSEDETDEARAELMKKLKLTNDKLTEEIKKLKLGNNKTQGNFVDIEAVKGLFVMYSETVDAGWLMAFDNFVIKYASRNQLTREEMLEMKSSLKELSNATKIGAIESTQRTMRRLQTDASNQRGKGERL